MTRRIAALTLVCLSLAGATVGALHAADRVSATAPAAAPVDVSPELNALRTRLDALEATNAAQAAEIATLKAEHDRTRRVAVEAWTGDCIREHGKKAAFTACYPELKNMLGR